MKKVVFLFLCIVPLCISAQTGATGVYISDSDPAIVLEKPGIRDVVGGTIINVEYSGAGFNNTIKGAFEHACRLWEEKIPTVYPIKLQVKIANIANAQCLATVNFVHSDNEDGYDRIYEKRYFQNRSASDWVTLEYIRDRPDAIITFTSRKVFDYNINGNEIASDKYDFVTVAIQAIGKAVGFLCNVAVTNQSLEIIQPANIFASTLLRGNAESNYSLAISDNVYIKGNTYGSPQWKLYCPSTYDSRFSLNYFQKDPSNNETLFMQPGVSKGSVIRYIGKSTDGFFSYCGWDRDIIVGMGGATTTTGASTEEVIAYQGITGQAMNQMSAKLEATNGDDNVSNYLSEKREMNGIGNYVLMRDGSWTKYQYLNELSDTENYARTSDGYLRLKTVTRSKGVGNYYNWTAEYKLYKYPPQKPAAAMNSYRQSDYSTMRIARRQTTQLTQTDDEFVDVEIGFKNVEGCKRIIVEQTDSDYPVPYTYYVDVDPGCFIAYMNKKYPSAFRLTYYNDEGNTVGDSFTIDLTKEKAVMFRDLDIDYKNNTLFYKFNSDERINFEGRYQIVNILNPAFCIKGTLSCSEGCIDTNQLPSGAYIFTAISDGKTYSVKWTK